MTGPPSPTHPAPSDGARVPFFASRRERRLWICVLAAVVAIYATLGLAGTLAGALRHSGLLQVVLFVLGMSLVAVTVIVHGLGGRPRAGRIQIAVAIAVAAAWLMVFVRVTIPEERSHLIEYGALAVLIHAALAERARQGRRVPLPALLAALATVAVGVVDECIQAFLPNRVFDPEDILFNVLAAGMAGSAIAALGWARRFGRRAFRTAPPEDRPTDGRGEAPPSDRLRDRPGGAGP